MSLTGVPRVFTKEDTDLPVPQLQATRLPTGVSHPNVLRGFFPSPRLEPVHGLLSAPFPIPTVSGPDPP